MKFFINTNNWPQRENVKIFNYSSFDEFWKIRHEGDVGARWGLWDNQGKLKHK